MSAKLEIRGKLEEISRNLWWAWNSDVFGIFRDIDLERWRGVNRNPVAFLESMDEKAWRDVAANEVFIARVERAHSQLQRYLSPQPGMTETAWRDCEAGPLARRPVAYFSAEFGIHECLPIYSGGLGVLAGDHVKSASDLGLPLVGVGLYYRQGYFRQRIDAEGWQHAEYIENDPDQLRLDRLLDADGERAIIEIPMPRAMMRAQVWVAHVGRVRLLLLDAAVDENHPELRDLSGRLYGGDEGVRLRQEMLLGIGGMRALRAAGIEPGVLHLNEGHSAFAVLELAHQWARRDGVSLWEAFSEVAARTVFTTHTSVPAGHDRFAPEMFEEVMRKYREQLGVDREALLSVGRVNTANRNEPFCMTVLALKGSRKANGVSALHGRVSRRMWKVLYPYHTERDIPIGHITNGIHILSWIAQEMDDLYVRHFGADWPRRQCDASMWARIEQVDDRELWDVKRIMKMQLIRFVRRRLVQQRRRWGASEAEIASVQTVLDPDLLMVGFARRFATYKRAMLIMKDVERFLALVRDPERPVQFVFAGKAHPADAGGQQIIQTIHRFIADENLQDRFVFLEDYDINVGRHLVQGVELWLNNPRRPLEASGTSGQKVGPNGGLNLSILDGWWPEAYDGANGFAVESTSLGSQHEQIDERDAAALLDTFRDEVLPLYYERDHRGLPVGWIRRVKRAIRTLNWRFNTDRMVMDYTRLCYLPAADAANTDMSMT